MRAALARVLGGLMGLVGLMAHAQQPIKYALAPELVVTDPSPDPRFPGSAALKEAFQKKVEAAFPGRILRLSEDVMISPDERVLVLVPTLSAVRVAKEVKAGVIDHYEAVIVGDLSALDPWTNANLFSATRMVSAVVELGKSNAGRRDELLRQAFEAATARWLDACLEQLSTKLAPFVLEASTLAVPSKASALKGGIWPQGRDRGVKKGATLRGLGHFARVVEVGSKYAVIQDVADAGRKLPAGERYSLTVVDKPTERPEPTVSLRWRGAPPAAPEGTPVRTLETDAFLGLLGNYLSQAGGLKLLPPELNQPAAKAQLQKIHEYIARHSQLAQANFITLEQRELALIAKEAPDRIAELGILDRYHGTRMKAGGSVEHYYRVQLGAVLLTKVGADEAARYPLNGFLEHSEELAQVEQEGVRELDAEAAWFTVCRNGVINLAKKLQAQMLALPSGDREVREATIDAGRMPQWKGGAPGSFAPLQWLRSAGELMDEKGASLGPLWLAQMPSRGFLNAAGLSKEKLEPGDLLRGSGAAANLPLVAFGVPELGGAPAWLPEAAWLAPMAAAALASPAACRFVLSENGAGFEHTVVLNGSTFGSTTAGDATSFTGQWRVRVQAQGEAQPILKFGLQTDHVQRLERPAEALHPLDTGSWSLDYVRDSLKKLGDSAVKKNLNQALAAQN